MTWLMVAAALLLRPCARDPALLTPAICWVRASQEGSGVGGILKENSCINGTKRVLKTRVLIFTTRRHLGVRSTTPTAAVQR